MYPVPHISETVHLHLLGDRILTNYQACTCRQDKCNHPGLLETHGAAGWKCSFDWCKVTPTVSRKTTTSRKEDDDDDEERSVPDQYR